MFLTWGYRYIYTYTYAVIKPLSLKSGEVCFRSVFLRVASIWVDFLNVFFFPPKVFSKSEKHTFNFQHNPAACPTLSGTTDDLDFCDVLSQLLWCRMHVTKFVFQMKSGRDPSQFTREKSLRWSLWVDLQKLRPGRWATRGRTPIKVVPAVSNRIQGPCHSNYQPASLRHFQRLDNYWRRLLSVQRWMTSHDLGAHTSREGSYPGKFAMERQRGLRSTTCQNKTHNAHHQELQNVNTV